MCCPIFYLLLVLVSRSKSEYDAMMIKFYGRVESQLPSTSGSLMAKDTCVTKCLDDKECVLAYMDTAGYCLNYKFSSFNESTSLLEVPKSDGLMVAVKTNEMVCPTGSYLDIKMAYVDRRNDANYPFEWVKNENGWTIKCTCPAPGMIFKRSETMTVCVKRYDFKGTNNDARKYCEDQGLKMVGVANQAELDALTCGIGRELWVDGTTSCITACSPGDYTFQDGGLTTSMSGVTVKYDTYRTYCLYALNGFVWANSCDQTNKADGSVLCGFALPV
ncbi:hypothetical protein L5515_015252 [Caenorhabditis briggsae]|uniref:PAN-3 domain-containing protein n=1 Tax=Caenorhabditis briggsae TaxID=6238 RepID=A0AAE9DQ17_CAEBR|nr:hypothetical protein L3Y34_019123 [Caenorhabditis briggsae]UMM19804.1 hypothetical protein L5515_015252 [Caenorhabditis briggsae]